MRGGTTGEYSHALASGAVRAEVGGKVGEQVAIAVAQANGCEYCLSAHTAIGGMHGVSAANLASARHGHSDDPKTQAAITLALEIVRTKGRVSDATLAAAHTAGFTDGDIVEVRYEKIYASFGLWKKGWAFLHYFHEAVEPQCCEVIGNIHDKAHPKQALINMMRLDDE